MNAYVHKALQVIFKRRSGSEMRGLHYGTADFLNVASTNLTFNLYNDGRTNSQDRIYLAFKQPDALPGKAVPDDTLVANMATASFVAGLLMDVPGVSLSLQQTGHAYIAFDTPKALHTSLRRLAKHAQLPCPITEEALTREIRTRGNAIGYIG